MQCGGSSTADALDYVGSVRRLELVDTNNIHTFDATSLDNLPRNCPGAGFQHVEYTYLTASRDRPNRAQTMQPTQLDNELTPHRRYIVESMEWRAHCVTKRHPYNIAKTAKLWLRR